VVIFTSTCRKGQDHAEGQGHSWGCVQCQGQHLSNGMSFIYYLLKKKISVWNNSHWCCCVILSWPWRWGTILYMPESRVQNVSYQWEFIKPTICFNNSMHYFWSFNMFNELHDLPLYLLVCWWLLLSPGRYSQKKLKLSKTNAITLHWEISWTYTF
jgi:hypothetical protein